jgi:prophage antirepressor-like protein
MNNYETLKPTNERTQQILLFDNIDIRRMRHDEQWYFSVVDVVKVLTNSNNPKNYWSMLKTRESEHGIELYTNCVRLELAAEDGKLRATDCANTEELFRIIQSIPSKKAEPFKQWLAKVGHERLQDNV